MHVILTGIAYNRESTKEKVGNQNRCTLIAKTHKDKQLTNIFDMHKSNKTLRSSSDPPYVSLYILHTIPI